MEPGVYELESIISSKSNKYLMKIRATFDARLDHKTFIKDVKNNMNTMSFKILGNNIGCIDISLSNSLQYNQGSLKKVINDYAVIDNIKSDKSCSISGNLETGKGTLDMIYTSLQTVIKICSWIKYFHLVDVSIKNCINGNNSTGISLSCYNIALYRKTWYERVLNVIKNDIKHRNLYKNNIEKFYIPAYKIDWLTFIGFTEIKESYYNFDIMKSCYEQTNTFAEFFDTLQKQIKNKEDLCMTLRPWIEHFMKQFIFNGKIDFFSILSQDWVVEVKDVPIVEFKDPWLVSKELFIKESNYDKVMDTIQKQKILIGGNESGYKIL